LLFSRERLPGERKKIGCACAYVYIAKERKSSRQVFLKLLPFRKNSSSLWGARPSACSILIVKLKEKRSLCLSNRPKQ